MKKLLLLRGVESKMIAAKVYATVSRDFWVSLDRFFCLLNFVFVSHFSIIVPRYRQFVS
jgi:hypothetical protein